jgi:hypothetical protein
MDSGSVHWRTGTHFTLVEEAQQQTLRTLVKVVIFIVQNILSRYSVTYHPAQPLKE